MSRFVVEIDVIRGERKVWYVAVNDREGRLVWKAEGTSLTAMLEAARGLVLRAERETRQKVS